MTTPVLTPDYLDQLTRPESRDCLGSRAGC